MSQAMRAVWVLGVTLLMMGEVRADGDPARGEARFQECAACHMLDAGSNGVGPSLHGIFERKAGELSDFRYSPALKRSGIVWSPQTLEAYLTDPQASVPGNRMPYAGMTDPQGRADLIAYLARASK
jgi:cytochrome c